MSVKKMGSKLAQGVRQVKAQQVSALVEEETGIMPPSTPAPLAASIAPPATPVPVAANIVPPAKPAPKPAPKPLPVAANIAAPAKGVAQTTSAAQPVTNKAEPTGALHPSRVWPD